MSTEAYRVEGPWPGTLAISARPRGGDWLEDEVRNWRAAGFDTIVSLLTPDEVEEMDLQKEAQYCHQNHLELVSFPIVDRSVPDPRAATLQLIERLEADLARGKSINIHCRQGIGRSSLIAAALLIAKGVSAPDAIRKLSEARHSPVPETPQQREWIDIFASSLSPLGSAKARK